FTRDPRSAGLGIGLQFFPVARTCTADTQCSVGRGAVESCAVPRACVGAMPLAAGVIPPACSVAGAGPACGADTTRLTVRRWPASGTFCYAVGQPCAAGTPDLCQAAPRVCPTSESCAPADYQRLALPIVALPGGATPIANRLDAVVPAGGTPTGPALAGALT